ncbi:MAG: glycoside hydrolase family 1 protein [Candidatus Omnitrophota bacterium]
MMEFPRGFLWGAATAAHQVEGNNSNSDWWEWERTSGLKESSLDACRHYDLYRQDFDLARSLHHNAHRLSVEWARIEPRQGEFDDAEIAHYLDVIAALKERGIRPLVTLHHFTNPIWFSRLGGWNNRESPFYFSRYVEKITAILADKVDYWITINEPLVYTYHAYLLGVWPPQQRSLFAAMRTTGNFARAHIRAYRLIHAIYRKRGLMPPKVSIAKNTQAFIPCRPTLKNTLAVSLRDWWYNFRFIDGLYKEHSLDFIGINYYSPSIVNARRWWPGSIALETCNIDHHQMEKNSLGWYIYPEGLYDLLVRFKKYRLPIIVTENGICTGDDAKRWDYVRGHLGALNRAIAAGADVRGYLYWSLLDNFEWDKGFAPRFGLVDVDYRTFKRTARESAIKYADVCLNNRLI